MHWPQGRLFPPFILSIPLDREQLEGRDYIFYFLVFFFLILYLPFQLYAGAQARFVGWTDVWMDAWMNGWTDG